MICIVHHRRDIVRPAVFGIVLVDLSTARGHVEECPVLVFVAHPLDELAGSALDVGHVDAAFLVEGAAGPASINDVLFGGVLPVFSPVTTTSRNIVESAVLAPERHPLVQILAALVGGRYVAVAKLSREDGVRAPVELVARTPLRSGGRHVALIGPELVGYICFAILLFCAAEFVTRVGEEVLRLVLNLSIRRLFGAVRPATDNARMGRLEVLLVGVRKNKGIARCPCWALA